MRISCNFVGSLALAAALTAGAAGCGAQSGKTVMTQGRNAEPVMGVAPDTGTYSLFTAASMNATATARVDQGQPLGFRRAEDGHLMGIAGSQSFDLPKGTVQAYWKLQKSM